MTTGCVCHDEPEQRPYCGGQPSCYLIPELQSQLEAERLLRQELERALTETQRGIPSSARLDVVNAALDAASRSGIETKE